MVRLALGLGGVAIAAQVACHDSKVLAQRRRNLVPDGVGLRMPVKQQDWRSVSADDGVNRDARFHLDLDGAEPGKKWRGQMRLQRV